MRMTLCWHARGPDFRYACTLPLDHESDHEDHLTDAPAIVSWPRQTITITAEREAEARAELILVLDEMMAAAR